ncbi:MAG TPA: Eco57I restriction-modification methylase domain-containing protein [Nevskiaceae bacterium]|nr:Eco57I restriction-modification methylase domain-containing protein [Nevskiaceae bacterium]
MTLDSSLELDLAGGDAEIARTIAVETLHRATSIYTRSAIVEQLLKDAGWPGAGGLLCDPSAGDGSFLDTALKCFLEVRPTATPDQVLAAVEGWEIHGGACREARERLAGILSAHGWDVGTAAVTAAGMVRHGDFLTEGPRTPRFSVCAGNPPYLRAENVPGVLREAYDLVVPDHAKSDMLHAFLDRCADVVLPDGVVCMVTSDRWLSNSGAARLREALGRRLKIKHLSRIDGQSAFYRPKTRRAGTPPRVHPVTVILERSDVPAVAELDGSPIYPGAMVEESPLGTRTLADVATVRLSPWLGTNGIFVVGPEVARTLPEEFLTPVADGRDFTGGLFKGPRKFAIRTEGVELPGVIIDHLKREMPRMCARGRRDPWTLPPENWWGKIDLSRPSLVVPRICKGLTPIHIPAGVLCINHAVTVHQAAAMSLDQVDAVLRRAESQRWIEQRAARLENGYVSVTTTLLRRLPVPEA